MFGSDQWVGTNSKGDKEVLISNVRLREEIFVQKVFSIGSSIASLLNLIRKLAWIKQARKQSSIDHKIRGG